MRKNSHHLREEDRKIISMMSKEEYTQTEIARIIGCHQSTISKELSRNRGLRGYRPKQAQKMAFERKNGKEARGRVIVGDCEFEVIVRLESKHSPEQISGALGGGGTVSTSAVYNYVYEDKRNGGLLYMNLRINGKRRYRHRNKSSRSKIPNRTGIEERPAVVAERMRYGDWEADLIEGARGQGALLSLYERKSRFGKLVKLAGKDSGQTAVALIRALQNFRVKTITYDNGLEFAKHELVSSALGSAGYFCNPYSSWEKGGVENYNGLVRQYFPKGCDMREVTQHRLGEVEDELNNRPRKIMGFKTPQQHIRKLAA